ncbi:response regulator [Konateibacter massiliensis]|uniref:response regulator n=1 Tax=Konateibacter massiliensis TaxID=2002841 RepID=UPI000C15FD03|nr:response regulator [Konateibacter massiliensis]
MINLLIVDDEPLVQIGIKSMLNWSDFGINICGTAGNGQEALTYIEEFAPEIVLTDIKMPVMNGLELIQKCRERHKELPLFIILTSYEEFALIKEAIRYQVLDYLVKLELDAKILTETIEKALQKLNHITKLSHMEELNLELPSIDVLRDKFFIRLLHNLFSDKEEIELRIKDLNINLHAPYFAVSYCKINGFDTEGMAAAQQSNLYDSTLQMMKEIAHKHMECHLISLDMKHFCFIFLLPNNNSEATEMIYDTLQNSSEMVYKYFNVTVHASVGRVYDSILMIADSYQDARQISSYADEGSPILFFDKILDDAPIKNAFNIALFKEDIIEAFEEMNTESLQHIFSQLCDLFAAYPAAYLQAIDAACNILYLAISLLPQGENIVSEIFSDTPDGYRCIYRYKSVPQVIEWLTRLQDGLCNILQERKSSYKNHIILNVQKYINSHIEEKLSLNDIAFVFGISPNYLSALFKKNSELGFTDYVNTTKIKRAKVLLKDSNLKVYEVADQLGFESAFYFSKVFKKVEGISPREFIQQI